MPSLSVLESEQDRSRCEGAWCDGGLYALLLCVAVGTGGRHHRRVTSSSQWESQVQAIHAVAAPGRGTAGRSSTAGGTRWERGVRMWNDMLAQLPLVLDGPCSQDLAHSFACCSNGLACHWKRSWRTGALSCCPHDLTEPVHRRR